MSTDTTTTAIAAARLAGEGALSASALAMSSKTTDRQKVAQLAQEFESYVTLQMLRQMRQAMLDDEKDSGFGADTMIDTIDEELARQMARSGGMGLAAALQGPLERQALPVDSDGTSSGNTGGQAPAADGVGTRSSSVMAAPAAGSDSQGTAVPLPLQAPVTSHYGWRSDPFNGTARFHSGVDLRAAYGREVPAAEAGQVVFSGGQGGYGNTVVIQHAGGVQTRYAHLSSIQVEVGQTVEAGAIIGRVGSSGRSTGPHLHFEVLQSGHQLDPEVAATRYAGLLKSGGVNADFRNSQPSADGVAAGVDDENSGQ